MRIATSAPPSHLIAMSFRVPARNLQILFSIWLRKFPIAISIGKVKNNKGSGLSKRALIKKAVSSETALLTN